jgi:hypothetical protein
MKTGYYLPLFFQSDLLSTPFHSGLLVLPVILSESLSRILSGMIVHRISSYLPLICTAPPLLVLSFPLYTLLSLTSTSGLITAFQAIVA